MWDVTPMWNWEPACTTISTHTSHVGCDTNHNLSGTESVTFLLTHPMWDVTETTDQTVPKSSDFYSHIPCGMWRFLLTLSRMSQTFLLTHPMWDVTQTLSRKYQAPFQFLLTHPMWDVTWWSGEWYDGRWDFYSHIPCGMWHSSGMAVRSGSNISTHTSHVGCDLWYW